MTARAVHTSAPDSPIGELKMLALNELYESPWNPRQHYDVATLRELGASLKTQGQLAPIVVRTNPKNARQAYEIGAGHRRFRAAHLAGLTTLLAVVRDLDDVAFTELLNIENLQRDDLHLLEEAQGFRDLMERAGYDVAKIADRIGRSTKYVYDRVKLLQLVPEAKKLFLAGEFEAGHAIILARLAPADQRRAIQKHASGGYARREGLFQAEIVDPQPDAPAQEQLKLEDAVKPVSVREFQTWVDDNVRMKPEDVDPFLFPGTAQLLTAAKEEDEKVVHITHDYRVPDAARDEKQRTYGDNSWKRADGKHKSKPCDYSVIGVVVAGPGRGEAYRVCVQKDKCKTHWPTEQRELAWQARNDARRKKEEAERARWKKAVPALLKALAEQLKQTPATPTSITGRSFLDWPWSSDVGKYLATPRTAEDLVRWDVFDQIAEELTGWYAASAAPKLLKPFGIDAKKIIDEVAPPPKPPPPAPKKGKTKKVAKTAKGKR